MSTELSDTVSSDTIDTLSEYILETTYDDLPEKIVEMERWHVLDTLGCALFGSTTPWIQKLNSAMNTLGEQGDATLYGDLGSVSPARASLINGTTAHALDYDDHTKTGGLHGGCTTIPPALAYCETADRNVDGKEFLTAVAIGNEIGVRSGYGIGIGSLRGGLHIAGWTGAFASAATVGKLYGLDNDEMGHALGIGGTQGCGLTGAHASGADVKRFHMGKAGEAGYLGVGLADQGFSGDRRIFEDRHGGIGRTLSSDFDVPAVTENLGSEYKLYDKLTFKTFPSVGLIQGPVQGVREILEEHDITTDNVAHVTVGVTDVSKAHVGWDYEPTGIMAAQSNMPFAIASFLEDGEIGIESYMGDAYKRPNVVERTKDIEIVSNETMNEEHPGSFGGIVEVETTGGETYTNPKIVTRGEAANPMSQDELLEKFRTQASYAIPDEQAEQAIDFILNIEEQDDVSELVQYLTN
jgi:2-methylcitrate dehydratase PrpD